MPRAILYCELLNNTMLYYLYNSNCFTYWINCLQHSAFRRRSLWLLLQCQTVNAVDNLDVAQRGA